MKYLTYSITIQIPVHFLKEGVLHYGVGVINSNITDSIIIKKREEYNKWSNKEVTFIIPTMVPL